MRPGNASRIKLRKIKQRVPQPEQLGPGSQYFNPCLHTTCSYCPKLEPITKRLTVISLALLTEGTDFKVV